MPAGEIMTLDDMQWERVSFHRVILAWVRAERDEYAKFFAQLGADFWPAGFDALLDDAGVDSDEANRARLRLFYQPRLVFLVEIPPDTVWYKVHNLRHTQLNELRTVNYGDWKNPAEKNELLKVAARKNLDYKKPWNEWEPPILWGHDSKGPFTIIEGNNRLTGYAGSRHTDLDIPVFVGLSPTSCHWHIIDDCGPLMNDKLSGFFEELERLRKENADLRQENATLKLKLMR
jgi:hypothetical protein